jgi:hypothetical protein
MRERVLEMMLEEECVGCKRSGSSGSERGRESRGRKRRRERSCVG